MMLFFGYGDFNKGFLRASDCDVDEILLLFFHPGLGGVDGGHPSVATEEINGWPFESFGLVNGGKG